MGDTPTTSKKPEERFQKEKYGSFFQKSAKNSVSQFLSAPSEQFSLFFVVACCWFLLFGLGLFLFASSKVFSVNLIHS